MRGIQFINTDSDKSLENGSMTRYKSGHIWIYHSRGLYTAHGQCDDFYQLP